MRGADGGLAGGGSRRISKGISAGKSNGRIVSEGAISANRNVVTGWALRAGRRGRTGRHAGVVAGGDVFVIGEQALIRLVNVDIYVADGVVVIISSQHSRQRNQRSVRIDRIGE